MAVTEITKILFRRGTAQDRVSLEQFGGLAQGEPGFTVVGDWEDGNLTPTKFDVRSAYLRNEDVISYTTTQGGVANENGGGDLFIGGSEGADIYIGGSSAEKHYQRYFVSLRGTGYNTNWNDENGTVLAEPLAGEVSGGFIDGRFVVGKAGGPTGRNPADVWEVMFFGSEANRTSPHLYGATDTSGSNTRALWWKPAEEALELWSNSALKLPVGTKAQRPGGSGGVDAGLGEDFHGYKAQVGMIRYNDTDSTFEGYDNSDNWSSLGGASDVVNQTYITVVQDQPTWSVADTGYNTSGATATNVRGETGVIKFVVGSQVTDDGGAGAGTGGAKVAGYFDNSRNLHVTQDIIAFSTSDERQKDNVQLIDNPTQKIAKLDGVTFTWSEDGPSWVDDRDSREDVGLLAQQVEQVIPEAVTTRDDGYKAVDYKRVIPLLVESIKELTSRVEELESR